jgi:hypothetical protein
MIIFVETCSDGLQNLINFIEHSFARETDCHSYLQLRVV